MLSSASDGDVYRILNDSYHNLTVKPNAVDHVWNSGTGYGIEIVEKGTLVTIRGNFASKRWDILSKTGGKVLIEGLKLHEPMNEITLQAQNAETSRVVDKTKRHMGTAFGDVRNIPGTPANTEFPPSAFVFDGVGDYIGYEDSPDWDIFGDQVGHKTVAGWVYHNGANAEEFYLLQSNSSYSGTAQWGLRKTTANDLMLYVVNGGSAVNLNSGSLLIPAWNHVAFVINGVEVGTYLNGSQVAYEDDWVTLLGGVVSFTGSLFVGQRNSAEFLTGRMQDWFICKGNNPYNASPNDNGGTGDDSFTVPAAPFIGVM